MSFSDLDAVGVIGFVLMAVLLLAAISELWRTNR
jgi:hypothetical protein